MSKIRRYAWVFLLGLLVTTGVAITGSITLNIYSIKIVKAFQIGIVTPNLPQLPTVDLDCQARWLQPDRDLPSLLVCSPIFMDMISAVAPADLKLAKQALILYPDHLTPLYWLAEIDYVHPDYQVKFFYERIISLAPNEGLAWCRLGDIYEGEGNLDASLQARINCCANGDPGYHGCYLSGKMYESRDLYNEAIRFYRLSRWETSRIMGEDLKAKIDSGEIIP